MKRILSIILVVLALCVACKGKTSEVNNSRGSIIEVDSVLEPSESTPFDFLKRLGVDYERLIVTTDTLPPSSDKDFPLTTKEQAALIKAILYPDLDDVTTISGFLVSVKQIYDDIILCQYKYQKSEYNKVFMATYNTDGSLIDALFAVDNADRMSEIRNLSDSTKLISSSNSNVTFNGNNEFAIMRNYKELEHNVNNDQDSTTFYKSLVMKYNIESNGIIKLIGEEVDEGGIFRIWEANGKTEWDLFDEMQLLSQVPFSDETLLEKWENLSYRVDGAPAEAYGDYFYEYVFMHLPEKVLKRVYDNREIEFEPLRLFVGSYYSDGENSRAVVSDAIANLSDPEIRAYFEKMIELWKIDPEYNN